MKKNIIVLIGLFIFAGCSNEHSENSISSLLISKNNIIVKEEYFNGKKETDKLNVQSITKSIISILVGIAIEEGFIENEETSISEYFKEESLLKDKNKKRITIKHLLNHTSGLKWDGYLDHDGFSKSNNPQNYVLQKEMIETPGEIYNYNSGGTHLLSIILTKSTGLSTFEFANKHLFEPLNFETIKWDKLNDGFNDGAGFGLSMHSKDLIKIGQLLLNKGRFNEIQVIPNKWINKTYNESLKKDTKWGLRKSKHGYGWYSKMKGEKQILYAMGYGGQFVLIIPAENLVVVSTHNHDTPDGIKQQIDFLQGTFPQLMNEYGS